MSKSLIAASVFAAAIGLSGLAFAQDDGGEAPAEDTAATESTDATEEAAPEADAETPAEEAAPEADAEAPAEEAAPDSEEASGDNE